MNIRSRQYLRYRIVPVNRLNISVQFSAFTRNQEMTRLTHTSIELKLEVTVKFIGLNLHPIPTSTHLKHQTFPSLFVVTSLQFTSSDEPPFDHQWRTLTFFNTISGLKNKTTF